MVQLRKPPNLPSVLPGGGLVPAMSPRDFAPMAIKCWQDAGGQVRLTEILEKDDDHFMDVTKIVLKRSLPSQVEHGMSKSVEDFIAQRDAQVINGEVVEITDAVD